MGTPGRRRSGVAARLRWRTRKLARGWGPQVARLDGFGVGRSSDGGFSEVADDGRRRRGGAAAAWWRLGFALGQTRSGAVAGGIDGGGGGEHERRR